MSFAAREEASAGEDELRATWAKLQGAACGPLRTLDPARELATPLVEVHAQALAGLDRSGRERLAPALAAGLRDLALAQLDAFPGNLFWDLDFIAAAIVHEARRLEGSEAVACVRDRFARMVRLQILYGRETAINFSYVHDFVYGFDWAKWVAREPSLHAAVPGPMSRAFLVYMEGRGHELLGLIADDDREYPRLPEDQPRNPFPFSREPEDEIRLHRELARRDLIPVPAWLSDYECCDWSSRWRTPYRDVRAEVAGKPVRES